MSSEPPPRGFESPYEQFVWKELSITRLEREGQYYQALVYSVSLCKYLFPTLRDALQKEGRHVLEQVNQAVQNTTGPSFYGQSLARAKVARQMSQQYLEKFVTSLGNSLGPRQYMEKRSYRTGRKEFDDLDLEDEESEG